VGVAAGAGTSSSTGASEASAVGTAAGSSTAIGRGAAIVSAIGLAVGVGQAMGSNIPRRHRTGPRVSGVGQVYSQQGFARSSIQQGLVRHGTQSSFITRRRAG
jgi:hypothetical protein